MTGTIKIIPITQEFTLPLPQKKLPREVTFYIIAGKLLHCIDAGIAGACTLVQQTIAREGYSSTDITSLFLTHSHPDHIGGALSLVESAVSPGVAGNTADTGGTRIGERKRLIGCSVYAHKAEVPWITDTDAQYKARPVPGFHQLVEGDVHVTTIVQGNSVYTPEPGLTIEALHTPGHSPGSVSYFIRETGSLFTGDALILPNSLPMCTDGLELFKTLELIKNIKGLNTIYTAWGAVINGPDIEETLEQCEQYLKKIKGIVEMMVIKRVSPDSKEFCAAILTELGFPPFLANPIVEKSFISFIG